MPTKYRSLLFKCQLLESNNIPVEHYHLDVEYLDVLKGKWEKLELDASVRDGHFSFIYTIPTRIPKADITPRIIRETIASGSLPMFRIVKSNTEKTELISQMPYVIINSKSEEITIDFQKVWLLDSDLIVNRKTETLIASPIFIDDLHKKELILEEKNKELLKQNETCKLARLKEKEKLDGQINKLLIGLNEQKEKVLTIEELLEEKEGLLLGLKKELDECNSKNNEEEVEQLQLKLQATRHEIEVLKKEQSNLQEENNSIFIELEKAKGDLNASQNTIDNLVKKSEASKQLISEKDTEIKILIEK